MNIKPQSKPVSTKQLITVERTFKCPRCSIRVTAKFKVIDPDDLSAIPYLVCQRDGETLAHLQGQDRMIVE
jgi:DNA-directed RNA polymerase subunit RPC12/RpoP